LVRFLTVDFLAGGCAGWSGWPPEVGEARGWGEPPSFDGDEAACSMAAVVDGAGYLPKSGS